MIMWYSYSQPKVGAIDKRRDSLVITAAAVICKPKACIQEISKLIISWLNNHVTEINFRSYNNKTSRPKVWS